MVKNEDFKVTKGEDKLELYQFHSKGCKALLSVLPVVSTPIITQDLTPQ